MFWNRLSFPHLLEAFPKLWRAIIQDGFQWDVCSPMSWKGAPHQSPSDLPELWKASVYERFQRTLRLQMFCKRISPPMSVKPFLSFGGCRHTLLKCRKGMLMKKMIGSCVPEKAHVTHLLENFPKLWRRVFKTGFNEICFLESGKALESGVIWASLSEDA